jgi:hypothetical protein
MTHTRKNKNNNNKTKKKGIFKKSDFSSGDGFLVSIWGPLQWTFLHIMSFNYPVNPTPEDKKHYRDYIINLQNVLPCKHCRMNLKTNLKQMPITAAVMKNRETFSRYVYELHELVNKMLDKKSNLSYCDVLKKNLPFLNLKNFKQERKKKKDVQSHYMVKNQNVLLILYLKKKKGLHFKLIKNVLRRENN